MGRLCCAFDRMCYVTSTQLPPPSPPHSVRLLQHSPRASPEHAASSVHNDGAEGAPLCAGSSSVSPSASPRCGRASSPPPNHTQTGRPRPTGPSRPIPTGECHLPRPCHLPARPAGPLCKPAGSQTPNPSGIDERAITAIIGSRRGRPLHRRPPCARAERARWRSARFLPVLGGRTSGRTSPGMCDLISRPVTDSKSGGGAECWGWSGMTGRWSGVTGGRAV